MIGYCGINCLDCTAFQGTVKVVSERLGHASITMTLDTYSHVMPDMQRDASDKMEELLSGDGK